MEPQELCQHQVTISFFETANNGDKASMKVKNNLEADTINNIQELLGAESWEVENQTLSTRIIFHF